MSHIAQSFLLIAYFPLDAQRSAVANLFQSRDKSTDVDLPLTERHFLTPDSGRLWPITVLDVNAADVRSQNLHGPQRIALVIKQHIGRIEVYLQIGTFQFVERAAEQVGGFLAGLESDGDALLGSQGADLAERIEERFAIRTSRLRQEAGVQHQIGQPQGASAIQRPAK